MKIEGAIPRGQPTAVGVAEAHWASPSPNVTTPCDDPFVPPGAARRPALLRGTLSSLRYQTFQNAPTARANTTPPGPNSTDSQLADELQKSFGELHAYVKEGRLTPSSLRQIAAQALGGE